MQQRANQQAVEAWLRERVAALSGADAATLDANRAFAELGLDSVAVEGLVGDLERRLGRPLPPNAAWDHPSIRALARHLVECGSGGESTGAAAAADEPIAVVGLAGRFPGAPDLEAFWRLLREGREAVGQAPAGRFHASVHAAAESGDLHARLALHGGFLEDVELFDAELFGISPREALAMDPQQRLLLESAHLAIEDAGVTREGLHGSPTGVFVGISTADYLSLLPQDRSERLPYFTLGNAHSIAANRISYVFGLRGPSLSIDSACSSSLLAIHLACESLRRGECERALAAGVNLILAPDLGLAFARAGALAGDGRCKAFDARADGYVRGEGVGVLVLRPLSRALADGDAVRALILASAVNNDGASNGLTAPCPRAQEEVLREAWRRAGVAPGRIRYVEAHGTGTALGDPIEIAALAAARGDCEAGTCLVGSVKSNVGHLEAAAGICGLTKTILALQQRSIPPSLHFETPNPRLDLAGAGLEVASQGRPWPEDGGPALAGVSSFGFGGTNVHVVLSEAVPTPAAERGVADDGATLLPLSARSPAGLRAYAAALRDWLRDPQRAAGVGLADVARSLALHRSHRERRATFVARSPAALARALDDWLAGELPAGLGLGCASTPPGKLAFVFSGHESQWPRMGSQLAARYPVFRRALEACDAALRPHLAWSLLAELEADAEHSRLEELDVAQPAIFALQVALAALWRSWGIEPDVVVGASLGEVAAAQVAGALSLEDAARIACERSRLGRRLHGRGRMAVVQLPSERVERELAGNEQRIAVAAEQGPATTTLAGEERALGALLERLRADGVRASWLRVPAAGHCPQLDPLAAEFRCALEGVQARPAVLPFFSSVSVREEPGEALDVGYWQRNAREPVRFWPALRELVGRGTRLFLELGPHPVLYTALDAGLRHLDADAQVAWSMRRGADECATLLESLGAIHAGGREPHWDAVLQGRGRFVRLPASPWEGRRRFWPAGSPPPAAGASAAPAAEHDLYELRWEERHPPPADERAFRGARRWVVFADRQGVGQELAAGLERRGHRCAVVPAQRGAGRGGRSPDASPGDALRALEAAEASLGAPADAVVHLRSLDAPDSPGISAGELDSAQELGCRSALHLVQALRTRSPAPALWLVTRGAQAVRAERSPLAVARAPVWGLGRVLALEQPELLGGLVDLDPDAAGESAEPLLEALLADDGEDQLALRDGRRWVPRLTRRAPFRAPPWRPRPDATYLVTGGLGAWGLELARHLADAGARHLVLTRRRPLADSPRADAAEALRALGQRGVRVRTLAADAADEASMRALLGEIADRGPPLRGVFHLAGVAAVARLADLDADALGRALRPKLLGGWTLHELTRELDLDVFVLFSSVASVWGSEGLGAYAAANHALDAIAHHRRALGLPASAVDWLAWSGVPGMALQDGAERLVRIGLRATPCQRAVDQLRGLLGEACPQAVVAELDWEAFKPVYEARRRRPLLEHIATRADAVRTAGDRVWLHELLEAGADERRSRLRRLVRRHAAAVLGFGNPGEIDPFRGFFDVGMDSIMAVELRGRLETVLESRLPATLVFEHPSVMELASFLEELLCGSREVPALEAATGAGADPPAELAALSDAEVAALLERELAALSGAPAAADST